jgi:hypothetical protein
MAAEGGWVACGSYGKARGLRVEEGEIVDFEGYTPPILIEDQEGGGEELWKRLYKGMLEGWPVGCDTRLAQVGDKGPHPCDGGWAYGCSLGAPVEALLSINGWDEDNDSMGGEDYACGMMLHRKGHELKYHPAMMTIESEEAHSELGEKIFKRIIKGPPGPRDASQVMYSYLVSGMKKVSADYYGGKGLRDVREAVLKGTPFPVVKIPEHDWRDGQALAEM